ncbi:DNA repair protein rad52 [Friedmanniomyces endolithicus]|uniref:RAD52 homolog n=1 Tax=Friedmanniomyces endolithicus TaxID=329885 RepID=A0AAN6G477_9PEZI|nr:DNA repair protein rad52 [Friedmanniomyces endolithicus]KAK0300680.1 DNA repair protein rad52 [Friedmanniomyces endolithicus]KAK0328274.1 DNA repair protein rad52 [Friedmanniomyces endolithicus]KAK1018114.1 DNA repair protein rad52 [Friedmanniomyces endolithicus]KAK1070414.1 DNA repair protein rad52 [Friedmanniomyces endolithicus]
MPLPGDQHRDTAATSNPFLDHRPRVSDYTASEIATLQSRLEKQLGPEYISTRPGAGGGKVHYLAAEKVINLANEVFGFNGWSSSIQNVQIDFVDEHAENGKITLGLSTIVRVTLRDGTFHEDIGYGHIENCKGKAAAFEKAKKEAATDALKRALRTFGNVLGNCLYDKDYLQKVTKVKVAPSRWDSDNLHRHPDYAPIKKESTAEAETLHGQKAVAAHRHTSIQSGMSFGSAEFEDDFGGSGLDDVDFAHPDEVRLDDSTVIGLETPAQRHYNAQQKQGVPRIQSMPHLRPPNLQAPAPLQTMQAPQRPQAMQRPAHSMAQAPPNRMLPPPLQQGPPQPQGQQAANGLHRQQQQQQQQVVQAQHQAPVGSGGARSNPSSATTVADSPFNVPSDRQQQQPNRTAPPISPHHQAGAPQDDRASLPPPRELPPGVPEGFVTGRAPLLQQTSDARLPDTALAFNPHADSPSIRRTHGINPGKSAPVTRTAIVSNAVPSAVQPAMASGSGLNGVITPVRTNFVNPAADMNRRIGAPMPAGGGMSNRNAYRPPTAVGVKRPPLADVSNVHLNQMDGASDVKKQKTESPADGPAAAGDDGTVVPDTADATT